MQTSTRGHKIEHPVDLLLSDVSIAISRTDFFKHLLPCVGGAQSHRHGVLNQAVQRSAQRSPFLDLLGLNR